MGSTTMDVSLADTALLHIENGHVQVKTDLNPHRSDVQRFHPSPIP